MPDYPDIPLTSTTWYRLKKRYQEIGLEALIDKRKGLSYKMRPEIRRFIVGKKELTHQLSCAGLASLVKEKFGIKVSSSLMSHILKKEGVKSKRGRKPLIRQKSIKTLPVYPEEDKTYKRLTRKCSLEKKNNAETKI